MEKYCRDGWATDDTIIRHMRVACCVVKGTNTQSEYEIRIAFCTATMVTRTLLNVTFYVHCLFCWALFSISWNVKVLTEGGVTMTPVVFNYLQFTCIICCLVALLTAASSTSTSASKATACSQPPVPQWIRRYVGSSYCRYTLTLLMPYSKAKVRGSDDNESKFSYPNFTTYFI